MSGAFQRTGNDAIRRELRDLTSYEPFRSERSKGTPAVARISHMTATLDQPGIVGMAVKLMPPSGEHSDLLSLSVPVFPAATTRGFIAFLDAVASGSRAILELPYLVLTRRVSARALLSARRASKVVHGNGLATTFHGVQTFRLVTNATRTMPARSTPFRYRWVPDDSNPGGWFREMPITDNGDPVAPVRFHLELLIRPIGSFDPADPGDLDDPRRQWNTGYQVIRAGTLTLTKFKAEPPGGLSFNPSVLGPGISMGPNDLFNARQTAYTISFNRRAGEAEKGVLR